MQLTGINDSKILGFYDKSNKTIDFYSDYSFLNENIIINKVNKNCRDKETNSLSKNVLIQVNRAHDLPEEWSNYDDILSEPTINEVYHESISNLSDEPISDLMDLTNNLVDFPNNSINPANPIDLTNSLTEPALYQNESTDNQQQFN